MIPRMGLSITRKIGFPRVSGDDPLDRPLGRSRLTFSPRERG